MSLQAQILSKGAGTTSQLFPDTPLYNKDLVRIKTVLSALHFPPKNNNSDTDLQRRRYIHLLTSSKI